MTVQTYSTAEVAVQFMGCSERWLVAQLRSGRFRGRKVGRYWRMTEQDVEDAIESCANATGRVSGNVVAPIFGLTPTSRRKVVDR